jgi:hypothetical protein
MTGAHAERSRRAEARTGSRNQKVGEKKERRERKVLVPLSGPRIRQCNQLPRRIIHRRQRRIRVGINNGQNLPAQRPPNGQTLIFNCNHSVFLIEYGRFIRHVGLDATILCCDAYHLPPISDFRPHPTVLIPKRRICERPEAHAGFPFLARPMREKACPQLKPKGGAFDLAFGWEF